MEYCNDCRYLNLTEKEQNKNHNKENHKCKLFNRTLFHFNHHPNIPRLRECKESQKLLIDKNKLIMLLEDSGTIYFSLDEMINRFNKYGNYYTKKNNDLILIKEGENDR